MERGGIAAQLYTVRDHMKTRDEIATSLAKVREAGYRAVEMAGLGPLTAPEWKGLLDREGLTACSSHTAMDRIQTDLEAVIEEHRLWGAEQVNIPSMPQHYRDQGQEGFRRFAREASELGRRLGDAGLRLGYHNHSFEFVRFGPHTGMHLILENSDPRDLMAQIDTYWVQHGGGDPAAWIRLVKGRIPVVHVKDMVIADGGQVFAEVGEGNLNWPAIMDACRYAGVRWYVVEQDRTRRDPFESLAISYEYLKKLGAE
ncbi:MAG: sugar phosphate isomerase/epimerase [Anaerolineae bacterium]|nr:sugar phosphate isomerase/epimerase [Anaerolineae bacterium]